MTEEAWRPDCVHVYGTGAALCFTAAKTRNGMPTVGLDMAGYCSTSRKFKWDQKLQIQITRSELPVVTAVFCGLLPECSYRYHGPARNKSFHIERQGEHFLVSGSMPQQRLNVPVPAPEAYYIAMLLLGRLRAISPWASTQEVLEVLTRLVMSEEKEPEGKKKPAKERA